MLESDRRQCVSSEHPPSFETSFNSSAAIHLRARPPQQELELPDLLDQGDQILAD